MALYARTLSGIERERIRSGKGRGGLADKPLEELLDEALKIPELRDLLQAHRS